MNQEQLNNIRQFIHRFETEKPLYTLDEKPSLSPYIHGSAMSDFVRFMYNEKLVLVNYPEIADSWREAEDKKQFIASLNEEECLLLLSGFIRGDRFFDGLLASEIESGNVTAVLSRLLQVG